MQNPKLKKINSWLEGNGIYNNKINMKNIFFIVLLLSIFSCSSGLEEITKYHKNGTVSERIFLDKNKKKQGRAIKFYENGKINIINNFKNDKLEGNSLIFYENGKLEIKCKYDSNKIIDTFYQFFPNGNLEIKIIYDKQGNKLKEFLFYKNNVVKTINTYFRDTEEFVAFKNFDMKGKLILDESKYLEIIKYDTQNDVYKLKYHNPSYKEFKTDSIVLKSIENYNYKIGFDNLMKAKKTICFLPNREIKFSLKDFDYDKKGNLNLILMLYKWKGPKKLFIDTYELQLTKGETIPKDNLNGIYRK